MYSGGSNLPLINPAMSFLGDQFRLIQCLPKDKFIDINQDDKLDCILFNIF